MATAKHYVKCPPRGLFCRHMVSHPKTNTMYHIHTFGASKCMHVIHSVGFKKLLILGRLTVYSLQFFFKF